VSGELGSVGYEVEARLYCTHAANNTTAKQTVTLLNNLEIEKLSAIEKVSE